MSYTITTDSLVVHGGYSKSFLTDSHSTDLCDRTPSRAKIDCKAWLIPRACLRLQSAMG